MHTWAKFKGHALSLFLWIGPNFTCSYHEVSVNDAADKLVVHHILWQNDGSVVDRNYRDLNAKNDGGH